MNKRKFLGTIIGVIFWTMCIVFFTYAYYEWKSINTDVSLTIQDLATKCIKGPNVNVNDIGPVFSPSDGVIAEFTLENQLATTQNFAIELNIASISDTLLVDDFKWMLVKNMEYNIPIASGDFSNFKVGTNTIKSSMALESNTSNEYQFIVYIDGNMENNTNMQNNFMKAYLEIGNCGIISGINEMINPSTSGTDIPYKDNIATAYFVNYTPFSQNGGVSSQGDVESKDLSLQDDSKIPSMLTDTTNLVYFDISKDQDGSIIAWYEDAGNNNYKLYIGSDKIIYLTDMSYLFSNMSNLTSISFDNIDTSLVTDMSYMFLDCSNLVSIDLSSFDTSNVTNMEGMFGNCSSLTNLDVSSFDTSNVTSMMGMFGNCSSLTNLNLNNFDTSNVTNMEGMFAYCSSLTNLDVSSFDTSNVTDMSNMFGGCANITSLDLSSFDTSYVTDMSDMFAGCYNLVTAITIRNVNTGYSNMFYDAATATGAQITINYTSSTSTLVDNMIATKNEGASVEKGSLVS